MTNYSRETFIALPSAMEAEGSTSVQLPSADMVKMAKVINHPAELQEMALPYTLANDRIVCADDLRRITVDGRDLSLSKNRSKVLGILAANADRVLTHKILLWSVWGPAYIHDNIHDNDKENLKVHITHLRGLLGEELGNAQTGVIRARRNIGYIALSGRPIKPSCPQD